MKRQDQKLTSKELKKTKRESSKNEKEIFNDDDNEIYQKLDHLQGKKEEN